MPGPPPNPNARRRNKEGEFVVLPPGRAGDPPPWPGDRPGSRQLVRWAMLWASPAASQWADTDVLAVYRYVRLLSAFDRGAFEVAPELRQIEDRLGLTPLARLRNRWRLPGETAEAAGDSVVRLRAV